MDATQAGNAIFIADTSWAKLDSLR